MTVRASPSPQSKRHHDRFSCFCTGTTECSYTLQWDAPFPLKIAPSYGGSGPHLIHGPESSTKTASRLVQPFFAGLISVSHRPTDRHTDGPTDHDATRSVTIGRIDVRSTGDAAYIINNNEFKFKLLKSLNKLMQYFLTDQLNRFINTV